MRRLIYCLWPRSCVNPRPAEVYFFFRTWNRLGNLQLQEEEEEEKTFIETKYIRRETVAKVYKNRSRQGHPAISI